jgi:23S rRNA pseudouridine1911/1915/1917 synthase
LATPKNSLFLPEILYEDNHCLAVNKPPGCLSTHYSGKEETLDRVVKAYLKKKYHKPGKVFLGIVHRLDRMVSGVLLFARTSKAAARLAKQFREGNVQKVYWAVVEGEVHEPSGTLEAWLKKDRSMGRVEVVPAGVPGAKKASLQFQRKISHDGFTWLELRPQTGRTHQLRVQWAEEGHPIFGDTKYGSRHAFGRAIALHARSLIFSHPIRKVPVLLTAPLPATWRARFEPLFREVQA